MDDLFAVMVPDGNRNKNWGQRSGNDKDRREFVGSYYLRALSAKMTTDVMF